MFFLKPIKGVKRRKKEDNMRGFLRKVSYGFCKCVKKGFFIFKKVENEQICIRILAKLKMCKKVWCGFLAIYFFRILRIWEFWRNRAEFWWNRENREMTKEPRCFFNADFEGQNEILGAPGQGDFDKKM